MAKPVVVKALNDTLTVTTYFEREGIHIECRYMDSVQHAFMRAYDGTQEELRTVANGQLTWLEEEILKAADARLAKKYPSR